MERASVLIVDDDPEVFELIEQILSAQKFDLSHAMDGAEGLEMVSRRNPDLILLDLVMPGLTGNDMLVGIKQNQYQGPIIVTPKRGDEIRAIEAFRLGATDFLTKPIRPPELMAVVERALEEVRLRQEKALLLDKVQSANSELEAKVRELTSLTHIGHLLTGMRSIDELFDTVLFSMMDMTGADHATIMLKDPNSNKIILAAGKNLTLVMQEKLGEEIRDEVAELVMTSKEPLVAAGDALQRFKISREIRAVVYVPIVTHNQAMGVLTVGNHKKRTEFANHHAQLIAAMANYVAVGITNARL
ncbi:MAG TPA: response regulator, partial [Aggregatilineales bacterium]|nr:response regulator [Aggregatilineales bacterium]